MSDEGQDSPLYDWDWRETPEWREVERAVANLVKKDEEAGDPMVTDFVIVAASVPSSMDEGDLLGSVNMFSTSNQGFMIKGLLMEGIDIQRGMEGDAL